MILEDDIVIGTFTHRTELLPIIYESAKINFPNVEFITQLANLPINANMEELRKKFIKTGKRFWVFLDDDIKFLYPDTLKIAVQTLIRGRYGLVGVYSTYDPYYNHDGYLVEKESGWVPGYFQMVDSYKYGDVQPDLNLPDPCTAIDTSYCVSIRAKGGKVALAPSCVYHMWKPIKGWDGQEIVRITNEYLDNKWGNFYKDTVTMCENIVGRIPSTIEDCLIVKTDMEIRIENRDYLTAYQKVEFDKDEPDKLKLNVGCGNTRYKGYVNIDVTDTADVQADMRMLPYDTNTVDRIFCHHVLEHIPHIEFERALKEFHRVLKPDGVLDIGMPDIELCCKAFVDAKEEDKWNWFIYTLYGNQIDYTKRAMDRTEYDKIDCNQLHLGGLTLKKMKEMLINIGFTIDKSFNYDGNVTPSLWVLARKNNG